MKPNREFKSHAEWFDRQFGSRPTTISPLSLKRMRDDAKDEYERLRSLFDRAEMWDEMHRASSYAWTVFGGRLGELP